MGKTTKKESTNKATVSAAASRAKAKVTAEPETSSKPKAPKKATVKVSAKKESAADMDNEPSPNAARRVASKKAKVSSEESSVEQSSSPSAVTSKRPARKPIVEPDAREVIRAAALKAAQYALEKKAVDVRLLDLKDITTMTDFFVIATGDSDRQVKAIAENVIAEMRDTEGIGSWRSEGWDGLQWVLVDFVDFVVHIFQTEARQYYNLERLWADAPSQEIKDEPIAEKPAKKKKVAAKAQTEDTDEEVGRELASGVRVISEFKEVGGEDR